MNERIDLIHKFWFTEDESAVNSKLWFGGGQTLDNEIRQKFEADVEAAGNGHLDNWQTTARGSVTLVVLLDQFPLNIYRKTARAFDFEAKAISICKNGLATDQQKNMPIIQAGFFLMPLMHSEAAEDQELSISEYSALAERTPEPLKKYALLQLEYAHKHKQTIDEYGRYPYRNEVLGRESTLAEKTYLSDNPSRYGQ